MRCGRRSSMLQIIFVIGMQRLRHALTACMALLRSCEGIELCDRIQISPNSWGTGTGANAYSYST